MFILYPLLTLKTFSLFVFAAPIRPSCLILIKTLIKRNPVRNGSAICLLRPHSFVSPISAEGELSGARCMRTRCQWDIWGLLYHLNKSSNQQRGSHYRYCPCFTRRPPATVGQKEPHWPQNVGLVHWNKAWLCFSRQIINGDSKKTIQELVYHLHLTLFCALK